MNEQYKQIIDYVVEAGKRLKSKAGQIDDIGVTKKYLTEEDLRIERDLKDIVETFVGNHKVYAEEENDMFEASENVWVIDPISGTSTFIAGLPHYAIVVSHLYKGETVFAVVYDPSVDELYLAEKGKGAFCNGQKIVVSKDNKLRIIIAVTFPSVEEENKEIKKMTESDVKVYRNRNSYAINYCLVAAGRYSGVVAKAHDAFPEFAGKLFIEEAGGKFTNKDGGGINIEDRYFVGGNLEAYELLKDFFKE